MIARIRLLIVLSRPAVVVLFALFATLGLAQAGHANDSLLLAKALTTVVAFLLFAVAVNDLSDEAIDRVNLAGDTGRPLVVRSGMHREMVVVAVASAFVALAASATLHWPAPIVVVVGLLLAAGYSLRPVRLADRGVVASLVLPAGYVAVPYLLGLFAARGSVRRTDVLLLLGLYTGFIGRILLKDFRDVRGDALFGKRTFLVRHGRAATCALSAAFWVLGLSVLLAVRQRTNVLVAADAFYVVLTLGLLRALERSTNARRDEAIISAIAIVGRGVVVTLFGHFAMVGAHWSSAMYATITAALVVQFAASARRMAAHGPCSRTAPPPNVRDESAPQAGGFTQARVGRR